MVRFTTIVLALVGIYLLTLSVGSEQTIMGQPTAIIQFSEVNIHAQVGLLDVDPDALDQLQDDTTGVNLGAGTFHVAQGVVNDRSPLTAFCVAVARIGNYNQLHYRKKTNFIGLL